MGLSKYFDSIPHNGLKTIMRNLGLSTKGKEGKFILSSIKAPIIDFGSRDKDLEAPGMDYVPLFKPK